MNFVSFFHDPESNQPLMFRSIKEKTMCKHVTKEKNHMEISFNKPKVQS